MDFWPLLEAKIVNEFYRPDLVVFCTQEEPIATITHSDILPYQMSRLGYHLTASKYVDTSKQDGLQTSVYIKREMLPRRITVKSAVWLDTMIMISSGSPLQKYGGLELKLFLDDLDISIINIQLPYNQFNHHFNHHFNSKLFKDIVERFVFNPMVPSIYFLAGSFNPDHDINDKYLAQVIAHPLGYIGRDSLTQQASQYSIREGVAEDGIDGPNFAPTCTLERGRCAIGKTNRRNNRMNSYLPRFTHNRVAADDGDHSDGYNSGSDEEEREEPVLTLKSFRGVDRKQTLIQQTGYRPQPATSSHRLLVYVATGVGVIVFSTCLQSTLPLELWSLSSY